MNTMSISEQDIFQEAYFCLRLSGTDPLTKSIWMKANVSFMLSVLGTMIWFTMKTFTCAGKDVDLLVDATISFTFTYQFASKLFVILYYKQEIADLIHEFSTFWPLEVSSNHEGLQDMRTKLFVYKKTIRTFFVLGCLNFTRYTLGPLLSSRRMLPYSLWLPENSPSPYYELLYVMEVYELFMLISLVVGIDGLFIAFAGTLGIQFTHLADRLTGLDGKQDLQECVEHHKKLVDCFKKLEKIFQFTLFSEYFLIVVTICTNLYIISVRATVLDVLAGTTYICNIMMELNIYCVMSQIVANESEKLTLSLYKSDWNEFSKQTLVKDVQLFMMFVKPLTFTILGILPVNMECYAKILQAAVSYYTIMKRFKSE